MEKFESNLFMKIGNFFFSVGFNYKTGGIKAVCKHCIISIKLITFKWKYKHSKKFRNRIISHNGIGDLFGRAVIEHVFFNKSIDYKYVYDAMGEEEKIKFKDNMEKALQTVIKQHNITDEKEIENLRSMFDFKDK